MNRTPVPLKVREGPAVEVPFAAVGVPAGFPSPAQDYWDDGRIDLNAHLIKDITCTFLFRVEGDSMVGAGIFDGDEVIIDRSIEPRDGHIVVAVIDDGFTLKRLALTPSGVVLRAENPDYPDIPVPRPDALTIWGVVTRCLHYV